VIKKAINDGGERGRLHNVNSWVEYDGLNNHAFNQYENPISKILRHNWRTGYGIGNLRM
jgi:hypothetical protein